MHNDSHLLHRQLRGSYPLATSAAGCWITDADGHRMIDWVNNFTALIHGHNKREIVDVIAAQAGERPGLKIPAHVVGIIPATENMPSGHALKPGDIIQQVQGLEFPFSGGRGLA